MNFAKICPAASQGSQNFLDAEPIHRLDPMPLLYKYLGPERNPHGTADAIGAPVAPSQLRTMTLRACDPSTFNDPFEFRPCFDQERHDFYAKSHSQSHPKH